jgi:hypothetical protein
MLYYIFIILIIIILFIPIHKSDKEIFNNLKNNVLTNTDNISKHLLIKSELY